jgi:hypothetical protein
MALTAVRSWCSTRLMAASAGASCVFTCRSSQSGIFACPDCVSFDPEGGGCSLGFPNEMHRDPSLDERSEVIFCKAFELA